MLGYTNLKMLSSEGVISQDAAPIHVPVSLRALLFAPAVGQRLGEMAAARHLRARPHPRVARRILHERSLASRTAGVLTKVGSDYLALLIHGTFNASIARPSGWSAGDLQLGREISFVVRSLSVADGLLSIMGDVHTSAGAGHDGAADERGAGGREKKRERGGVAKSKQKKKEKKEKKKARTAARPEAVEI